MVKNRHRHHVLTYHPQATRIKLEVCSNTGAEPPLRRQVKNQKEYDFWEPIIDDSGFTPET
jgi:hypothetical protein